LLSKSGDFRVQSLYLLIRKAGSKTPGIDKMTLNYNVGRIMVEVSEFVRDTLKNTNIYKPQAIKKYRYLNTKIYRWYSFLKDRPKGANTNDSSFTTSS